MALTHSDNVDANSLCSIRNLLIDIGIQTDNIVNVCSVEKRMIGGKSSKPFGKELLIEKIQKSFWTMICDTISEKIRIKAKSEIEYTTNKLKLYIDKSVNFFNMHSNRKMKVINEFCNEEYRLLGVKIGNFTSETVNEALYYYMALCNMFFLDCCQDDYAYKKDIPHFEFSMDFEDKLAEDIAMIVVSFVPIINLLVPQLMTEIKRDEYKQELLSRQDKLIEICDRMCDEIMHSINELKV